MHRLMLPAVVLLALAAPACFLATSASTDGPSLDTVDAVDLERYIGKWYEIASYPTFFNANCTATTAEYAIRDDGTVSVINECRLGATSGPLSRIEGSARVVDEETNAKLEVSFFLFPAGNYWIIDLDEEYQWAVVGEPSRRTLFILSRTPSLDAETYQGILDRLAGQSYDPAQLTLTPQATGTGD